MALEASLTRFSIGTARKDSEELKEVIDDDCCRFGRILVVLLFFFLFLG